MKGSTGYESLCIEAQYFLHRQVIISIITKLEQITMLSANKDRFLNHYVKLPKTFFGEDWAKETYGADYKKMYDLVKLYAFKKGGRGHQVVAFLAAMLTKIFFLRFMKLLDIKNGEKTLKNLTPVRKSFEK